MIIKQQCGVNITIDRFDGKGQVTLEPGVELEVDDATGAYLLSLVVFQNDPVKDTDVTLASDFIEIS